MEKGLPVRKLRQNTRCTSWFGAFEQMLLEILQSAWLTCGLSTQVIFSCQSKISAFKSNILCSFLKNFELTRRNCISVRLGVIFSETANRIQLALQGVSSFINMNRLKRSRVQYFLLNFEKPIVSDRTPNGMVWVWALLDSPVCSMLFYNLKLGDQNLRFNQHDDVHKIDELFLSTLRVTTESVMTHHRRNASCTLCGASTSLTIASTNIRTSFAFTLKMSYQVSFCLSPFGERQTSMLTRQWQLQADLKRSDDNQEKHGASVAWPFLIGAQCKS